MDNRTSMAKASIPNGDVLETPRPSPEETSPSGQGVDLKSATSSAGSTTASSATERMSNNNGSGAGNGNHLGSSPSYQQLPESTKQPILETIDQRPTAVGVAQRQQSLPNIMYQQQQYTPPPDNNNNSCNGKDRIGGSPRSIRENDGPYRKVSCGDLSETNPITRSSPPRPADGKSFPASSSSNRRHYRTHSDEIPRLIHGGYQPQVSQPPLPAVPMPAMSMSYGGYNYPAPGVDPRSYGSYQQSGPYGPPPPQMMHANSERIMPTYSADQLGVAGGGQQYAYMNALQASHSFGNQMPPSPKVPSSSQQMGDGRPQYYHAQSERNSSRSNIERNSRSHGSTGSGRERRRSRHKKSHSYTGQVGIQYGSFWAPPPPPPPMGCIDVINDANYVPQSPGGDSSSRHRRSGSGQFDRRNELWTLTSSLRSPRSSDHPSPQAPLTPIKNFRLPQPPDARVSFSPSTPGGGARETLSQHSTGGEAVYLLQKRHKAESSRRKHIRQHSAQLFMEDIKGTPQRPACRDIVFLLLFVFHLFFIVLLGNLYAKEALGTNPRETLTSIGSEKTVTVYYNNLLYLSVISGAFAIGVSSMILAVMSMFAKHVVQVALVMIITLSFVWGTAGIGLSPKNVVPITGIIALALSVAYAFIVWDRIPFAAANLVTALTAIRKHPGTVLVALVFQTLCLGWSVYYCIVVIGVFDAIREGKLLAPHRVEVTLYVFLGISFYWTYSVLLNTVQAVTAGVVGKWWLNPDERNVVAPTAFSTVFYSMGSICFGSLFVGPVRIVRQIAVIFRPTADEASLLCLHECLHCVQSCITNVVDSLANRFNSWAFTYIGLYKYGFTEAGRHATELFDKRGWTKIATDDLVPNVLLMTSLVLGGLTGCFALAMQHLDQFQIMSLGQPSMVSFWLGFVNGLVLTSVLFGVISSSVSTVLVCFAGSPVDFDTNYPELSDQMRNAWREVWPGALDVVDLRVALASPNHGDGLGPLMAPPPPLLGPV